MKKQFFLIVMMSLALSACQNEKAPAAKAPAEPAAVTANVAANETKQAPVVTEQKQAAAPESAVPVNTVSASDAVAVTKPAETQAAQSVVAAMHQASADVKSKVEAIQLKPAAVKEVVEKKATVAAVKAAPAPKAIVAPKALAVAKPVEKSQPLPKTVAPVAIKIKGDLSKGKALAKNCAVCHNFTDKKKVGPGLKGIVGRKAGIMPGMKYSAALAAGGGVWNEKNPSMWSCDSKKAVKVLSGNPSAKTKMPARRICDPARQADLIAFLKTL